VSTARWAERPVSAVLDDLHAAGVTAIEIGTPPRHFDPWRHDELTRLGSRLKQLSIRPISVHAPFGGLLDLTDPNPQHRHAAIGAVLSAASALRGVGGSRVVVHLSDVPRLGENVNQRLQDATAALRVLARTCAEMQTMLIVETPPSHVIGGHPEEFAQVIERLDSDIGVCLDTSHATLGHHWHRFLAVAGHRLVHVHLNDHRGRFDDHLAPGDGLIDWPQLRESFQRVAFDGWFVLDLAWPAHPLAHYVQSAIQRTCELLDG
jgi:sugar phosphate isomerase/epimerase